MFQFEEERLPAVIKVIGVGGGGSNAVSTMVQSDIKGVQFIVVNTDMQALELARAPIKLQIGSKITNGRGAGANPEIGRSAALEDADKIKAAHGRRRHGLHHRGHGRRHGHRRCAGDRQPRA